MKTKSEITEEYLSFIDKKLSPIKDFQVYIQNNKEKMIYVNDDKEVICPRCDGNGQFEKIERKNKGETYYICNNCELVTNSIEKLEKYVFIAGNIWYYIKEIKKENFNASEFYNTQEKVQASENDDVDYLLYNGEEMGSLYSFEN